MPLVDVTGVFMGANLKNSTYDGVTKTAIYIDIYQPNAQGSDKVVQIKSDDVNLLNQINNDYDMGSVFKAETNLSAYQNKSYFKLINLVQ